MKNPLLDRNPRRSTLVTPILLCLLGLSIGFMSTRPLGAQENLDLLSTDFDLARAQLQETVETQRGKLGGVYLRALEKLQAAFSSKGDLDSLLIVKKEHTRFSGNPTVNPLDLRADLPELLRMQNTFLDERAKIQAIRDRQLVPIYTTHLKKLEQHEVNLTRQNRISEALKVKKAREALQRSPEWVQLSASAAAAAETSSVGAASRSRKPDEATEYFLHPKDAVVNGNTQVANNTLAYWTGDESYAEWTLGSMVPGKYEIYMTYANAYSDMDLIMQVVRNTSSSRVKKNRSRIDTNPANVTRLKLVDTGFGESFETLKVGECYVSPLMKLQLFKDPESRSYGSPFIQSLKLVLVKQ